MKAQTDSNSRGQKDFICREFSWRKEKRKNAYWRMQGDQETGVPMGVDFIAYFALPEGRDAFQTQTGIS
jgi:hypothetical protein